MVDPTGLNEQQKRDRKGPGKYYGKSFLAGLLGGLIGGTIAVAVKWITFTDCFLLFVLAGIGVVAMYLYFVDKENRSNRQIPFLFLSGAASVVISMFFYLIATLHRSGWGVSLRHIYEAYFMNTNPWVEGTMFIHLFALMLTFIGIGIGWLYIAISVPRWEKKGGSSEEPKRARRKKK